MATKNNPQYLLVHTSVSTWGTVADIREWHLQRGFNDIGYQYVIENGYPTYNDYKAKKRDPKRTGLLTIGRTLNGKADDAIGAHCTGYNSNSIGVCLIGDVEKEFYDPKQIDSLLTFLAVKCRQYSIPVKNILGHYETPNGKQQSKTCPDLKMNDIRAQVETKLKQWGWLKPIVP